jgi:serine phosphatase RsbU (regulator of sigma subunit)/PAS domain-containing protein
MTAAEDFRAAGERDRRRFLLHGLVDQAAGVLMARTGCTSAEAFVQLADIGRRTGRDVAEIAADLVGAAVPRDPAADLDDVRCRPAVLAMDRAADGDELAELLVTHALGWSGPSAAVVAVLGEDGALDVLGFAGFADRVVSPWRRIPPVTDCLMTRAVRKRSEVWIDAAAGTAPPLIGETVRPTVPVLGTRVAVPVSERRRLIGVVEIAWPTGSVFTSGEQREIAAVAQSVAAAVTRTVHLGGKAGSTGARRRGDGDARADFRGSDTVTDRRDDVVPVPVPAPVPPSVPPSVRLPSPRSVDMAVGRDRWKRTQRLGRVGTWEWDLPAGEARWSSEALRILGSRAVPEPMPIASPPYVVHPDDASSAERLASALVADGRPAEAEMRVLRFDGTVHHVRFAGEPIHGADGLPVAVFGTVQDVTDRRRAETDLEVARVQLAAQRMRVDAERQLAVLLQQIIMPAEPVLMPEECGIEVAARYRPASAVAGVGGDWYGIFPLPDARVLLTVGDVAGHGLTAASTMAQLYHALRGLVLTGAGPAELLTWLNTLTAELPSFTVASACCALYDPAERELRWANAGHPSPVLVSRAGPDQLQAPTGTMLGASPASEYVDAVVTVSPEDVVLFYTDGLVERRGQGHDETTAHLLAEAADPGPDLEAYADRILDGARSDTDDDKCLIAVRFR